MLIRPIWDWNELVNKLQEYGQEMLIRPIWDWNTENQAKEVAETNVNQTNLGLKS